MTITEAEGQEFAASWISAWSEGFNNNTHDETMKGMLAEKFFMSWSDGTEGEQSREDFMKTMKESWGAMIDKYIVCNPLVTVDTDQSRIVISTEPVFNMPGGGLVANNCIEILLLNEDKQVVRWSGIWDPNNKTLVYALAKVYKKLGKEMPEPKQAALPITVEEGRAFAQDFLKVSADGFPKNNHRESFGRFLADELAWDWSDGTKGEGTFDDIMKVIEANWGTMCDSFHWSEPTIAVDTNRSVIALTYQTFMNITGGFNDENNPIKHNQGVVFHLNKDKKCIKWHMCWNHSSPEIQAVFAKVMKRLEAAKQTPKTIETPNSNFLTGQSKYIHQGQ